MKIHISNYFNYYSEKLKNSIPQKSLDKINGYLPVCVQWIRKTDLATPHAFKLQNPYSLYYNNPNLPWNKSELIRSELTDVVAIPPLEVKYWSDEKPTIKDNNPIGIFPSLSDCLSWAREHEDRIIDKCDACMGIMPVFISAKQDIIILEDDDYRKIFLTAMCNASGELYIGVDRYYWLSGNTPRKRILSECLIPQEWKNQQRKWSV